MTRSYERHPLSARYADITGQPWEDFKDNLKAVGAKGRKIVLHEGKVLDGWQLYRACQETGIKPEFTTLPEGVDPVAFVETWNDHRRHEPPEVVQRRLAERRERVAAKRTEGKSLRAIAEEEGVSEKTVRNDIGTSTAEGYAVEPPNGVVTGKDNKERSATKPPVLCPRCARVGATEGCPKCAELRNTKNGTNTREPGDDTEAEAKAAKEDRKAVRNNGKPAFDDKVVTDAFAKLTRLLNERANVLKMQRAPAWANVREKMDLLLAAWESWQGVRV